MDVSTIHFSLTNYCKLKCPFCCRTNIKQDFIEHFDVNLLGKLPLSTVKCFVFAGTLGDFSFHPNFLELIDTCKNKNPNGRFLLFTNGTRSPEGWWREFGSIMKGTDNEVFFAIDGLEDTHSIHRIGADYRKVVGHMKQYIKSGGTASVQFLIFKHNEHQMMDVKKLADNMGCKDFQVKVSISYNDEFHKSTKYESMTRKEESDNFGTVIQCRMLDFGELFVAHNNDILTCCQLFPGNHHHFFKDKPLNLRDYSGDFSMESYFENFGEIVEGMEQNAVCNIRCRANLHKILYTPAEIILKSIQDRIRVRKKDEDPCDT